jgi:hypothetical protein
MISRWYIEQVRDQIRQLRRDILKPGEGGERSMLANRCGAIANSLSEYLEQLDSDLILRTSVSRDNTAEVRFLKKPVAAEIGFVIEILELTRGLFGEIESSDKSGKLADL